MKVAIIGTGVAGLVSAHRLRSRHEITVFEAAPRIGGHTHTVDVEVDGRRHAVDKGFIVYNEKTYPRFCALLDEIDIATQPTDMSFGVRCEDTGLEWASRGLRSVFAQPSNLFRRSFLRMLRDVARFNAEAPALLDDPEEKVSLGDYLDGAGYSSAFVDHYVVPMGAAIWSAAPGDFLRMPTTTFVRFFQNHGLLTARPDVAWRVVPGGSSRYAERLVRPFRDRIETACPVREIRRDGNGATVRTPRGEGRFDHVVLAVHSDQALRMLADPSDLERRVLSSIRYQENDVVLHTDASLLPRREAARASWNYLVPKSGRKRAVVTYDMNRLQGIVSSRPLLVTLNGTERIAPDAVLDRAAMHHPVFDAEAIASQRLHASMSGAQRTHYCGAYWGNGFHEDAVASAIAACAPLEAAA